MIKRWSAHKVREQTDKLGHGKFTKNILFPLSGTANNKNEKVEESSC